MFRYASTDGRNTSKAPGALTRRNRRQHRFESPRTARLGGRARASGSCRFPLSEREPRCALPSFASLTRSSACDVRLRRAVRPLSVPPMARTGQRTPAGWPEQRTPTRSATATPSPADSLAPLAHPSRAFLARATARRQDPSHPTANGNLNPTREPVLVTGQNTDRCHRPRQPLRAATPFSTCLPNRPS